MPGAIHRTHPRNRGRLHSEEVIGGGPVGIGDVDDHVWARDARIRSIVGGLLGGVIVWLAYLPHWAATDDQAGKLAVFSTGPAIRNSGANVIAEIIGTFVLVLALLTVLSPANLVPGSDVAKGFGPMLVGLIVWSIGLSLGGTTGYAINPARDLGPRIAHAILPIAGKGGSDWSYAWVPVVGPVIGGLLGAVTYKALWGA